MAEEKKLYEFSRSIYRRLAPHVSGDDAFAVADNQARLLDRTELAMERLGRDPTYFSDPTRSIFASLRSLFPLARQDTVYAVVKVHVDLAGRYVEACARAGRSVDGGALPCAANTRKGEPCARTPLAGHRYCPSHQHLEAPAQQAPLAA